MLLKINATLISFFLATSLVFADPSSIEIPKKETAPTNKQILVDDFYETTIKNKFEYPTALVFQFVQTCTSNVAPRMGMPAQQAVPAALAMCSCIMDQFRSDFKKADFMRGGQRLAKTMAPQYSAVCKSLITAKGM
jgi:hypothetical protein